MKAITLTQPWATLVAIGAKRWETRSWSTNHRGPLAIHAAKGMPGWAADICFQDPFFDVLHDSGYEGSVDEQLPRGAVIAICDLAACISTSTAASAKTLDAIGLTEQEMAFGDYSPDRYAWRLENVRRLLIPIPARGALGLWEWTPPEGFAL